MDHRTPLSRREFLRLTAAGLGTYTLPEYWAEPPIYPADWPRLRLEDLPEKVGKILSRVPKTRIRSDGFLNLLDIQGKPTGPVPLAPTLWNNEHSNRSDRLYSNTPWGIVLHWFGDREDFDSSIEAYLRGFDDLRLVAGEYLRTSAHFLVGEGNTRSFTGRAGEPIGILQTQLPDTDGTPFVASHLQQLDYIAHWNRQQYFVRALYQLGYAEPGVHSMLQDMFDGRWVDPNMRTMAVELCGYDFENFAHFPSEQHLANTLSILWALMERYNVMAMNLLGHHEIQLNKADPGKKFMALVRFLIGVKALVEGDISMSNQVFGPFLIGGRNAEDAVHAYFKFVRDYLVLTSNPKTVYEWEGASGYWLVADQIAGYATNLKTVREIVLPLPGTLSSSGSIFLDPENHEGIDLHRDGRGQDLEPVLLAANGICLFAGNVRGSCGSGVQRFTTIFRHRQPDGAEILTVSGHLNELGEVHAGKTYPAGYRLGYAAREEHHPDSYLHFAVGYGATWDTDLQYRPVIPLNAGENWIRQRYLPPETFLDSRPLKVEGRWKG